MSASRLLGTMVVRIAAEMSRYKTDINDVAKDTEAAANKIENSTGRAAIAARAMGGSMGEAAQGAQVLGAVAGVTGGGVATLAIGLGLVAYASYKGAQEDQAYRKSLILTGNAAGTTAGQMADMAQRISQNVGTQYAAAAALAAMAGTGQVAAGSLEKVAQVAVEMERVVGQKVGDTAKAFAELGQEPVKASLKLNESMSYLTASTFAQIKAAEELGDKSAAASIAQDAYATAMKTRTEQIKGNLGALETAWNATGYAAKWAWDRMLDIGRAETAGDKLAAIQKRIENAQKPFNPSAFDGNASDRAQLPMLLAQAAAMGGVAHQAQAAAKAQADQAASQKAQIAWMQEGDKYLSKAEKMEREITRLRFEGNAAGATELEIEKRIAVERAKGAEKKDNSAAKDQAERIRLGRQAAIAAGDELTRSNEAYWKSLEAVAKAYAETEKEQAKYTEGVSANLAKLVEQTQAQADHNARLGLSKEAIADLEAASLELQATKLDGLAIDRLVQYQDAINHKSLRDQAEELRNLAQLKKAGAAKEAVIETAKEAQAEWSKFYDSIYNGLTDSLYRAFEKGGSFFQNFWDGIKNLFKTTVLKLAIQGVVGGVMGTVGMSAANAATGGGGILSGLSNLSSLQTIGSVIGNGFAATVGSSVGAIFGATAGNAALGTTLGLGASSSVAAASAASVAGGGLAAGGLMTGLAAIPVWGWAAMAGVAALAIFGGGGGRPTSSLGGAEMSFDAQGKRTSYNPYWDSMAGSNPATDAKVTGLYTAYAASAAALGIKTVASTFTYAANTGKNGEGNNFGLTARAGGKSYSLSETAFSEAALNLAASRAVLTALQGSELPEYLSGIFDGVNAGAMSQEQINGVLSSAQSFKALHDQLEALPFENLKNMSYATASALVAASGGMEKLNTNIASYFDNFYSAEEKKEVLIKRINAAVARSGFDAATATRDSFRALVEAQDVTTESGRSTHAALLSVAGAFASITPNATDAAQALTEAAKAIAQTAIGLTSGGLLVPALDVAILKTSILGSTLTSTFTAAGQISTLFLDVNSGLITFGSYVTDLDGGLSKAQLSAAYLTDEITALQESADKTRINFDGLSSALLGVNTETFVATIGLVFESLASRIKSTIDAIGGERIAVREAAMQIINPMVMGKAGIERGIAGVNSVLPSNAGVLATVQGLAQAQALQGPLDLWKAQQAGVAAQGSKLVADAQAAVIAREASAAAANAEVERLRKGVADNPVFNDTSDRIQGEGGWSPIFAMLAPGPQRYLDALPGANAAASTATAKLADSVLALQSAKDAAAKMSASGAPAPYSQAYATDQLASASNIARAATLAYASALQDFAIDASKSVGKLSKLREETVKYYEAQKQLADLMGSSAAGLRSTVADYRYSQLDPQAQFADLQAKYASAYSMALSTDGETLAGYGDKLNGLLNPLLEKAREVMGSDSAYGTFAATMVARAEAIAGRLDSLTPTNYAADSLTMLGQIDATLVALDASSQSAEKIIADAIKAGSDRTASGLGAIVRQLGGTPAFASGGSHSGGLRIVGENGPELEVTGPSRIFSANQTRGMFSGGGNTARLEALVERLTREVEGLRAEAQATAGHTSQTARLLDRAMPDGDAIATRVAA